MAAHLSSDFMPAHDAPPPDNASCRDPPSAMQQSMRTKAPAAARPQRLVLIVPPLGSKARAAKRWPITAGAALPKGAGIEVDVIALDG